MRKGLAVVSVAMTVGVFVVARDQIFIGIAVSQASTLGIALGMGASMWLDAHHVRWLSSDGFLSGMAVLFAIFAALLTARRGEAGSNSRHQ